MITDKLNRYIYEIDYSKRMNVNKLSFEEVVEMLQSANESERKQIMENLSEKVKDKIDALIEGGLI